jgi:hypothetical protein
MAPEDVLSMAAEVLAHGEKAAARVRDALLRLSGSR